MTIRAFLKSKGDPGVDMLVTTPARLSKLLEDKKSSQPFLSFSLSSFSFFFSYFSFLFLSSSLFSPGIDLSHVKFLILDEADKLFETSFLEQVFFFFFFFSLFSIVFLFSILPLKSTILLTPLLLLILLLL